MRCSFSTFLLLVVALGLSVAGMAAGQGLDESSAIALAPVVLAEGADVPRSFAFEAFLFHAFESYRADLRAFEMGVLQPLGVEPASQAAQSVEQAVLLGQAILSQWLDLQPYTDDPETFDRLQRAFQRDRAAQLGALYRDLRSDLTAAGVGVRAFDRLLDEAFVPTLQLRVGSEEERPEGQALLRAIDRTFHAAFEGAE